MATTSDEKVTCHTPTPGKKPCRIHRWKYEAVRSAILDVVPNDGEGVEFRELPRLVEKAMPTADRKRLGSIMWYTTTVKLDMDCQGEIERVPGSSPQRLRVCR